MKLLIKLAIILLIGFLLLGTAGYFLLPPAAKKAIEAGTHRALGTETQLEDISAGFGITSTSMGIGGFTANQPSGFEGSPLLKIGEIDVDVSTFSVISSTVKVPKVSLNGLELRLVQNGKESNFLQVYEHLNKLIQSGESETEAPAEESGGGKSIDIGIVSVAGVKTTFDLTGIPGIDKSYSYTLPAFEMDLSRDTNKARIQNVEQVTAQLVQSLIEKTVARAKGELPPELAALIGGDVGDLKARVNTELEKLKGQVEQKIDEGKNKLKEELGNELGETVDKVLDGKAGDAVKEGLEKGAGGILDGAQDKLKGKDKEAQKKADDLLKKGSKGVKSKIGNILGGDGR